MKTFQSLLAVVRT